ncbi:MAG: hypothetical protein P0Y53_19270 [Candidatus Pseudobacter hemicellulosilyticus]|uniref:Uncharacterized protein n=1 Tax=Candidatus Pseudobacter hemicellulosilyticus TaxID=3121375 RepID=A0AAJ5WS10_9BACT|nr:MAG: hypothetical protein P0Y53_19270 [Pseudobacter sp.]
MALGQFLRDFGIDPRSLAEIKKRVYIVGKFNALKPGVAEYIFSRSGALDERLRDENGQQRTGRLTYSSFIEKIEPQLSETFSRTESHNGEPLPYFILSTHNGDQKASSSYIIDNYNYFDVRASSNSDQPFFKDQKPDVKIKDFLDASRFLGNDVLPGKEIYKQIKENLSSFCSFQARNFELIQAFAVLLSKFAGKKGVPYGITEHSELPVNFVPVFIDFLYVENPVEETFRQKMDLIDFSSHTVFRSAVTDANKKEFILFLKSLFTIFKNYLNDPLSIRNDALPGYNIQIILNRETGIVSEELRQKFVASMEAYNMLTQIIQSKVLLSMVLRWSISYFENDIPEINTIRDAEEKNAAIENAILNGKFGLAKPSVNLPAGYSIKDLVEDFRTAFPVLLAYIFNPQIEENNQEFHKLSETIQKIGRSILADEQKRQTIHRMMSLPKEQRTAMFRALLNLFTDVIIPRLFKVPGLTEDDLIKKFREYEMELFFTSSMMEVANAGNIDRIIEESMGNTDNEPREAIAGKLINTFIGVLMAPDVQKRIEDTVIMLEDHQLLRKLIPGVTNNGQKGIIGIGRLTALGSAGPALKPGETGLYLSETKALLGHLDLDTISQRKDIGIYLAAATKQADSLPASAPGAPVSLLSEGREDNGSTAISTANGDTLVAAPPAEEAKDRTSRPGLGLAIQQYISGSNENRQLARTEVEKIVKESTVIYQKSLSKIFEQYAGSMHLPAFKSKTEVLVLTWLLLLNKDKLHLGELGSNLYDLLLDLIEKLDTKDPDLGAFFAQNSLTKYISANLFSEAGQDGAGAGFKALRTLLDNQSTDNLGNIVQFVSELKGVKYLIDFASTYGSDCEVVVINAYHHEFLEWIKSEHHYGNFLNPTGLANNNALNPKFPAMVFMTDLAFADKGWAHVQINKESFLKQLSNATLLNPDGYSRLIPPICLATGAIRQDNKEEWKQQGERMNRLAKDAVCPVLILGPSLALNRPDDYLFPTVLSSGYVLCAHLLTNGTAQHLKTSNSNVIPFERFRNLGRGVADLHTSIQHFIAAGGEVNKDFAFAADYYLYLIALMATAAKTADMAEINWKDYYLYFHYDGFNETNHNSSGIINEAMIHNKMTDWGLSEALFNYLTGNSGVTEDGNAEKPIARGDVHEVLLYESRSKYRPLRQAHWFDKVVAAHQLQVH